MFHLSKHPQFHNITVAKSITCFCLPCFWTKISQLNIEFYCSEKNITKEYELDIRAHQLVPFNVINLTHCAKNLYYGFGCVLSAAAR